MAAAGLETVPRPLRADRGFLPDLDAVEPTAAARAKALVLSYPNNPTAGVATPAFFDAALAFAERFGLLLIHDFPYLDLVEDPADAPSVLARPGGLARALELYSASKSFHMGGFRLGWAIGQADAIAVCRADAATFAERRRVLLDAMDTIGWRAPVPRASMYVWAPLPAGRPASVRFAEGLARATGVVLAPKRGFGPSGEGYVRFALVREPAALREAVMRIRGYLD